MTAIRVIFDGKAFVPQQPVTLPAESEALVLVNGVDSTAREQLDDVIRAYYQNDVDDEDEAWGRAVVSGSHRAWDED